MDGRGSGHGRKSREEATACPGERQGWLAAEEETGSGAGLARGVGQSWQDLLMDWEQLGAREAEAERMAPRFLFERPHGRCRHLL